MSFLSFSTSATFEMGDLVSVDANGFAVPYDPENPLPVVGPACRPAPGFAPNGRQYYNINGPTYYLNDPYIWQEDLTGDFTENSLYIPYNPLTDTGYVCAVTSGMGAVKKNAAGIPPTWIKLHNGSTYDWWLIR